jgi:hypothetical protein
MVIKISHFGAKSFADGAEFGWQSMNASVVDYDGLLQANLNRVFGERDAEKRITAIRDL